MTDPAPRRCLVLGGSGALGAAIVRALRGEGAAVALTYHTREAEARALASEVGEATVLEADLGRAGPAERVVDEAAEALGGLDVLVHAAAVSRTAAGIAEADALGQPLSAIDATAWDETLAVNARSAFLAVRRFAARADGEHRGDDGDGGGGEVVLVGSIDGLKPLPAPVHYAASKAALAGMTFAFAKELGPRGFRVNLVAPGILEDGISRGLPDELREEYLRHCGLRRLGRLDEVASVVAWFALRNTYATGQVVTLDGALS